MKSFLLTFGLFLSLIPLLAVGTKDIDINGKGIALSFNKSNGRYNNFMRYDCKEEERLYISLNQGEKLLFGLQTIVSNNLPNTTTAVAIENVWVRIKDKTGQVVFGPVEIKQGDKGYINTRAECDNGPRELNPQGYDNLEFLAPSTDHFYMEIGYNQVNGDSDQLNNTYFIAPLYDWTVVYQNEKIQDGRVWSKAWHILALEGFTPDGELNAQQYIYTDDGIISRLDYNGIIPYQYILISNSTGASATGDMVDDRKSIDSPLGNELLPQYRLFFDEPDTNIFKLANLDSLFGTLNQEINVTGCPGDYCINIDVNRDANAKLLIDLNGTVGFQQNTEDVLLEVILDKGSNCVKWNGKNGLGKQIKSAAITVDIQFVAGVTHLPMYDVEFNNNGLRVDFIYPKSIAKQAEIYWDDSKLNGTLNDLLGCPSACHTWTNSAYGNEKIINSWWYITKDPISSSIDIETYTLKIEDDKTICEGDSIKLIGPNDMVSYEWTPTTNTIDNQKKDVTVFPKTTTQYKLTIIDQKGCEYIDSLTVFVNQRPTVVGIAIPQVLCINDQSVLSVSGAQTYSWDKGLGIGVSKNISPSMGKTLYQVIGVDDKGCKDTAIVEVTVNALPVITVNDEIICKNDKIILNASGGSKYLWKNIITGLSSTTISNPEVNPLVTTTYTVEVTNSYNCISEKDVIVTVNELPIISVLPRTICKNDKVTLKASGGVSYLWKNITTGLSSTTISNPEANPLVNTTYTVEVTDENDCVSEKDVMVTVNPLPTPSFVNPKLIVCPEEVAIYQVTGSPNSTFDWSITPSTKIDNQVPLNDKNTLTFAKTDGNVTLEVTETDVNDCKAVIDQVIKIDDLVTIDFDLIDEICADASAIPLTMATPTTGGIGTYTLNSSSINTIDPKVLANDIALPINYKFTTNVGCEYEKTETIVINSLPVISFLPINAICSTDEPIILREANPKGIGGVYSGLGVINGMFDPKTIGLVIGGKNTITYTYTDQNNCVSSENSTIIVYPQPSVSLDQDIIICEGDNDFLTAIPSATNVTYQWFKDNSILIGETNKTLNVEKDGFYQVQVSMNGCDQKSQAKTVDLVKVSVDAGQEQTILFDQSIELSGIFNSNQNSVLKNMQWSNEIGVFETSLTTLVTPEQTTTYTIKVVDEYGCIAEDDVLITVLDPIQIPNGFTPNGDGKNETWIIANIEDYPRAKVKVFNRWGDVVFMDYGYLNDWDGIVDGKPLPNATYYYVVELNYDNLSYGGSVTIIR